MDYFFNTKGSRKIRMKRSKNSDRSKRRNRSFSSHEQDDREEADTASDASSASSFRRAPASEKRSTHSTPVNTARRIPQLPPCTPFKKGKSSQRSTEISSVAHGLYVTPPGSNKGRSMEEAAAAAAEQNPQSSDSLDHSDREQKEPDHNTKDLIETLPLVHPQRKEDKAQHDRRQSTVSTDHIPDPTPDTFESFQAADKELSAVLIKDMLLALRSSINTDFKSSILPIQQAIEEIGDRVSHVENKMGEFAASQNEIIDRHNMMEDTVESLQAKVIDLEDRSRRNNIKFRGVPESVSNKDLIPYITDLIKILVPHAKEFELSIDRAHRLPKPSFLHKDIPRDVLARFTFYHVKELMLREIRNNPKLPDQFDGLKLFTDLSAATIKARKDFTVVTRTLAANGLNYRWGFPVKVLVFKDGELHVLKSPDTALAILKEWKLKIEQPPHYQDRNSRRPQEGQRPARPHDHNRTKTQQGQRGDA